MNKIEQARERGRKAGRAASDLPTRMQQDFAYHLALYPTLGKVDLGAMVRDYDQKRLACEPDYAKMPEMRGLADEHRAAREGFKESSGLDDTAAAYHFSFGYFISRHVNAHHLARYDLLGARNHCTNVFFPECREGVTIADNRDDLPRPEYYETIPHWAPRGAAKNAKVHHGQGGVSSSCLLDEEPECIFPCDPWSIMPDECFDDIRLMVEFMTRYKDFYGPGNQIWVDRNLNAVAVEKTNARVAFRFPQVNGAVCITACSYLDPELNEFKKSRTKAAAEMKGESLEDSIDQQFFDGCDRRHRRLWELTNATAKNGAELWDALACVADTAVPFPDRVCLAGETTDPKREPNANWSLTQHAAVITGPHRRVLYRSIQDLRPGHIKPVYAYTPKLSLGEGVAMQPAWQADIDAGRCELVS